MPGFIEDPEDPLLLELKRVRRDGAGKLKPSLLPLLCEIAVKLDANDRVDRAIQIERALQLAIDQMGQAYGQAASLLLGTSPLTRGMRAEARRKEAADRFFGGKDAEAFYRADESQILEDLRIQLLALAAEHEDQDSPVAVSLPDDSQKLDVSPIAPVVQATTTGSAESERHPDPTEVGFPDDREVSLTDVPVDPPDDSVPIQPERSTHHGALLKPLIVGGFTILVAIIVLAATSTWPFGSNRSPGNQIPSPNALFGEASACPSSSSSLIPAPPIPVNSNAVHVKLQAQPVGATSWSTALNNLRAGTVTRFLLSYSNASRFVQNQVVLRVNLAPGSLLVPNSTCVYDASHLKGLDLNSNDVDQGGINVGNFGAGANAYLLFSVALPPLNDVLCGETAITTVGVAHPRGLDEFENSALTNIEKACANGKVVPGTTPPGGASAADSINARVRLPGQPASAWSKSMHVPAGDPVEWEINVVHAALGELDSTSVIDHVPDGVVVVPGSVKLFNANYPNGYTFPASAVQANGTQINLSIGDYVPLSEADVKKGLLSAQIIFDTEFASLEPSNCARHTITNNAWLGTTQYPASLHSSAKATVSC